MKYEGFDVDKLPEALAARDQWVCWRREERDGKTTKVPIEPSTGDYASTTEPDTWRSLETVLESVGEANADGIGFVFTDDDPIVGVDLDDCRDPESGVIDEWARDVVTRLDSYTEVSPSGTGVHVIVQGELPAGRSRSGGIEMYDTSRFFTVTGDHLDQTPQAVRQRTDALRELHEEHLQESTGGSESRGREPAEGDEGVVDLTDEEIVERAREAENGERFDSLWRGQTAGYDSHSEADMALCLHLAFWTGSDAARMDRLFRKSGLMRGKWDEVHYADGAKYGERTVERAIETVDEVYEPDQESGSQPPLLQVSQQNGEGQSDSRDRSAASDREHKSVYLEERNRLLREKVRTQQEKVDRLTTRIEELEAQLAETHDRSNTGEDPPSADPETRHPVRWIAQWLVGV